MSFTPLMESIVKHLVPHEGTVLELGSQTYNGRLGFDTTRKFYLSLGFTGYDCIDLDGKYGAIRADLNQPYYTDRTWTLVTNNGTGEHLFNQAAVFENMHRLSSSLLLDVLPWTGWIEHGFYNYQPNLMVEMAAVNDYEILQLGHANRDETRLHPISEPPGKGNVMLVVLMRKRSQEAFRMPNQQKWVRNWR